MFLTQAKYNCLIEVVAFNRTIDYRNYSDLEKLKYNLTFSKEEEESLKKQIEWMSPFLKNMVYDYYEEMSCVIARLLANVNYQLDCTTYRGTNDTDDSSEVSDEYKLLEELPELISNFQSLL